MSALLDWLFGCRHKDYTFPRTVRRRQGRSKAASVTGTYVVCLDCGKELAYDWQQMSVIPDDSPEERRAPVLELSTAGNRSTDLKDSAGAKRRKGRTPE